MLAKANAPSGPTAPVTTPIPAINVINQGVVTVPAGQAGFGAVAPRSLVANITGGTTTTSDIFLFNNDYLNARAATGTTGITTYGDGFTGNLYSQMILLADAISPGLRIYGFNINATVTSSGVADPTVFATAAIEVRYYTGYGSSYTPLTIDISGAERNTANNDGILTVRSQFDLTRNCQVKINVPTLKSVSLVFFTTPDFAN